MRLLGVAHRHAIDVFSRGRDVSMKRATLFIASLVLTATVIPSIEAIAQDDEPTAELTASGGRPGEAVTVTGRGWPPNKMVNVQLCGNVALDGSADCDAVRARGVATGPAGNFTAQLSVNIPPSPCPCVVHIASPATTTALRLPFHVEGALYEEPKSRFQVGGTDFEIVQADVKGSGPWTAWFGGPPDRTLVLTLRNLGTAPAVPPVTVLWGRDDATHLVRIPELDPVQPGSEQTYELAVRLDALSIGSFVIEGIVRVPGDRQAVEARTSSYPWGLFAIGLVVVQVLLLKLRNALRRRLVPEEAEAHEEAVVEEAAQREQRTPRRTLREVLAPVSVAVGRPVARRLIRRRQRKPAEKTVQPAPLRTRPLHARSRPAAKRNGNGSHRGRTRDKNGHGHRSPRDAISPLLIALGEPVYRAIHRDESKVGSGTRRSGKS